MSPLLCDECGCEEREGQAEGGLGILSKGVLKVDKPRYRLLLLGCLDRIPRSGHRINLPTEVRLKRRGSLPGVVGLTTYSVTGFAPNGVAVEAGGTHAITFYTNLLDQLSDRAVTAVMAHELAHAWLNEHLCPEASKTREDDADMLAAMWGFESELEALGEETEPIADY